MVKAKYVEVKALKLNGKSLADYIVMVAKKRLNLGAGGKKTTPKKGGGKKTTPKKPVCKCPKNMAPVCGKNGRTYSNACMAKCAKTTVVAKGACKKKTTPKKKPTKKPTKKLALAAKGKANCAGKGTPVKDINGCKAAAKAIKKTFQSTGGY